MSSSDPEIKRLKRVFGTVYFVQGMKGLPDLSIFFYMMNVLKLGPVAGQLFQGLSHIAWFIKPLWGWISDRFPIFGYRRKSYFVLMALVALVSWALTGLCDYLGFKAAIPYFILINMANLAYAFVDVVADATMVEQGQRLKQVGSFVNFQWLSLGFSACLVALFSGWFQQRIEEGAFSYWMIFAGTGLFPLLTALVGTLNLREEKAKRVIHQPLRFSFRGLASSIRNFYVNEKVIVLLFFFMIAWHFSPSIGYVAKTYQVKVLAFTPMIYGILGAVNSMVWILSILFCSWLFRHFKRIRWDHYLYAMIVLGVIALISGYYYYLPPDHPFSVTLPFSWDPLLAWSGKFESSTWWGWIHSSVKQLSTWNRYHWWAMSTDTLLGFAAMPAWLIPLTLAGEAASKSNAGFIYAMLMSVSNLTNAFEDVVGGVLYKFFTASWMKWFLEAFQNSFFNISKVSDTTVLVLEIFIYISAFFTVICIPFIYWVKKEFQIRDIKVHL